MKRFTRMVEQRIIAELDSSGWRGYHNEPTSDFQRKIERVYSIRDQIADADNNDRSYDHLLPAHDEAMYDLESVYGKGALDRHESDSISYPAYKNLTDNERYKLSGQRYRGVTDHYPNGLHEKPVTID